MHHPHELCQRLGSGVQVGCCVPHFPPPSPRSLTEFTDFLRSSSRSHVNTDNRNKQTVNHIPQSFCPRSQASAHTLVNPVCDVAEASSVENRTGLARQDLFLNKHTCALSKKKKKKERCQTFPLPSPPCFPLGLTH